MAAAYLGLGGNLGDRLGLLRGALAELSNVGQLLAVSSVYETVPWGDPDQPPYLNLCCALDTLLAPEALSRTVKDIELRLGRRPTRRWGPREIDVDLLLYDHVRIDTPELTVPHPRIAERAFVLAPLAEIAPGLRVPGLDAAVEALLAAIPRVGDLAWIVAPPPRHP